MRAELIISAVLDVRASVPYFASGPALRRFTRCRDLPSRLFPKEVRRRSVCRSMLLRRYASSNSTTDESIHEDPAT